MSETLKLDQKPWPQSLIDVLERQHDMVQRLAALAQGQSALIEESSTDQLLELLAQRQSIIDEFTQSQRELTELTRDLDRRLEGVPESQCDRIRLLIDRIGDGLAQVMQRDEQDQATLRYGREQVRQELSTLGTARQARNAYTTVQGDRNRYADRRG